MSRDRAAIVLACCVVLLPRVLHWGAVPAVIDGDEAGFFAVGIAEFANPSPPWTFGPNSLPTAHFWLFGLSDTLFGRDVWSGRLMTALFGAVQAVALVAASGRLAGALGALTTAAVLCLPLELHFERLAMCNVWTTATWSVAFAVVVLAGWRWWAAALAGALLAAGWYGYQSSRLVPLIAAAPLLVLLWRATWRQRGIIAVGIASFLVTLAPLLYGFWRAPTTFAGRAVSTSWTSNGFDPTLADTHLRATLAALAGTGFDSSPFLPYHVPLFPLLVTLLAVAGLFLARPLPLALTLAAWFGAVLAGNFIRSIPIYSCVLICAVPAVAVAAGLTARRLGIAAPLLAAAAVFPVMHAYFAAARTVPQGARFAMAHYRAVRTIPLDAPLLVGGGLGCAHGFNQLHRPCFDLADPQAPRPAGAHALLFPKMAALADTIPGVREPQSWDGVEVLVIRPERSGQQSVVSSQPAPAR